MAKLAAFRDKVVATCGIALTIGAVEFVRSINQIVLGIGKPAPTQPERKPQVGDTVWTVAVDVDGITPTPGCEPREDKVTDDGFMTEHRQYPRRVCDLGKTWWWDDPGAKGEG